MPNAARKISTTFVKGTLSSRRRAVKASTVAASADDWEDQEIRPLDPPRHDGKVFGERVREDDDQENNQSR